MALGLALNRNLILKENPSMLNSRMDIKGTFFTLLHCLLGRKELRKRVQKGQGERESLSLMRPTSTVDSLNQNISVGKYFKGLQLKQEVMHFVLELFQ